MYSVNEIILLIWKDKGRQNKVWNFLKGLSGV